MEFEGLGELMEWEARRVAAAFMVMKWTSTQFDQGWEFKSVASGQVEVTWAIESSTAQWFAIGSWSSEVDGTAITCDVFQHPEESSIVWEVHPHPAFNELMARGLYRLGFEDEAVLTELNHQLSAHEKLELRLSMPREFWPQKWRDEEGE